MQQNNLYLFVVLWASIAVGGGLLRAADMPPADPMGVLTLQDALALALTRSPGLSVYRHELQVAEARTLQAGLRPNPELEVEVEEFGGSGDRSGFDAAQATVMIGQPVELGGKRARRRHVASLDTDLVQWDYESAKLDVIRDATQAFTAVLGAQERLALADQLLELAQQVQSAATLRVEAGKDSPLEELRAGVVFSRSRIERQKAEKALRAARHALAAQWGGRTPTFEAVAGAFYEIASPVPLDESVETILANPDIARRQTEEQRSLAALRLEKARAVPDITIGGGLQRFEETDDSAFIVGLSLPLPLFDRNQGGIRVALAEIEKTRRQGEVMEIKTLAALAEAVNALAAACEQAATLRDDILPKARQAFETAEEGYRQGKFDYLYVLDAERTLFETRVEYIDSVEACHRARAEVERLTGGPPRVASEKKSPPETDEQPVTGERR